MVAFGLAMIPFGWILVLSGTVAPNWRSVYNISGEDPDLVLFQGIWDTCRYYATSGLVCSSTDEEYFDHRVVESAQRMMAASLFVALVGLAVAIFGVRCWSTRPRWTVVCLGGFAIICAGLLAIVPVAWYAHELTDIHSPSTDIEMGCCIFLGYLGGIMEVLGGFLLFLAMWQHGEKDLAATSSAETQQDLWHVNVSGIGDLRSPNNFKHPLEDKM